MIVTAQIKLQKSIGHYCKHKLRLSLLEHKSDAAVWRLYRKYKWRHERIWKAINTIQDFKVAVNDITMNDLRDKSQKYSEYMAQIKEYMTIRTGRIIYEKRRVLIEKCKHTGGNTYRCSGGSRPPLPTKGTSHRKWWLRWFDAIRPHKK